MQERIESTHKNKTSSLKKWINVFSVGWFLAKRQIKGSSKATTFLIVFIMMLTFLNLVVVSGILIGLIEGGNRANKEQYTGDVIITTLAGENGIENTYEIENTLRKMPGVSNISIRYAESGQAEANYKTRRDFSILQDIVGTQMVGIDLEEENQLSGLRKFVVEGDFLDEKENPVLDRSGDCHERL